jgi:hypothetical protein
MDIRIEKTVDEFGNKFWNLNVDLHLKDITNSWRVNRNLHREDGPAVEWNNGDKSWYLNGVEYTEQEYKYKMRSIKLKELLK